MTSARHAAALRIHRELPVVVSAAVRDIGAVIPTYRTLTGEQAADVEAIAFWSFRRLLQLWVDPAATATAADRAHFRAVGTARAYDGRPLSDVLRAYRVAVESLLRHISAHYLEELGPADVADISMVALGAIDTVYEQINTAYSRSRKQLVDNRDQARAALLDDLLLDRQNSPGALADRTRELDLDLPPIVMVITVAAAAGTGEPVSRDAVEALDAALAAESPAAVLLTRRGSTVAALSAPLERFDGVEAACASFDLHGAVACCALSDVAPTFQRIANALATAPTQAFAKRSILRDGDSHLLALLGAQPGVNPAAVITSILGPLTDPSHQHVLDGVASFIAAGTATEAAAALHLHPQTLRYRLRRARELSGLDPRDGWDRLALDVAVHLRQLHEISRRNRPQNRPEG